MSNCLSAAVNLGVPGPAAGDNHFLVTFGKARLRWEAHSEFITYTWDMAPDAAETAPAFSDLLRRTLRPARPADRRHAAST